MASNPVLDTNLIIRFLLNDLPEQADKVEKLFSKAKPSSLEIPDIVIAEIIYVLLSYYELDKNSVIDKIDLLIEFEKIKCNKKILKNALEAFKNHSISFVDAYLLAKVTAGENSRVYSFDKGLGKIGKGMVEFP